MVHELPRFVGPFGFHLTGWLRPAPNALGGIDVGSWVDRKLSAFYGAE
jgi:hypothetical protein